MAGSSLLTDPVGSVFFDGIVPSPPPAVKTAVAVAGAATLNRMLGEITSNALTTAPGATYTLTIANSFAAATDTVLATVRNGTNTAGMPAIATVTPSAGQIVIVVQNIAASGDFDGTLVIGFVIFKN